MFSSLDVGLVICNFIKSTCIVLYPEADDMCSALMNLFRSHNLLEKTVCINLLYFSVCSSLVASTYAVEGEEAVSVSSYDLLAGFA